MPVGTAPRSAIKAPLELSDEQGHTHNNGRLEGGHKKQAEVNEILLAQFIKPIKNQRCGQRQGAEYNAQGRNQYYVDANSYGTG